MCIDTLELIPIVPFFVCFLCQTFPACATHNRTCCPTFCPLLIFCPKNSYSPPLGKDTASHAFSPTVTRDLPVSYQIPPNRVNTECKESKERLLKLRKLPPSSSISKIFVNLFLKNIIRFGAFLCEHFKRSWKIWPNRIKTETELREWKQGGETLVILLWAPLSPSQGRMRREP